jgi:DNA-binding transcriptional ArsR family regulator
VAALALTLLPLATAQTGGAPFPTEPLSLMACPAAVEEGPDSTSALLVTLHDEGNRSLDVTIEPLTTGGWRVSPTAPVVRVAAGGDASVSLGVLSPRENETNASLTLRPIGGALEPGWSALRVALRANGSANEASCLRAVFDMPDAPPAPSVAAAKADASRFTPTSRWALGAAGAGVVGLVALAWSDQTWRLRLLAPFAPLFTRLQAPRVLEQEVRERVHAAIAATPGAHYSDLQARLGLSTGVLLHHLRVLERHHLVRSRREGRYRAYYPADARLPPEPAAALNPTAASMLSLARARGRVRTRDLPGLLGVTKSTVSYNASLLEERGLLRATTDPEGRWLEPVAADAGTAPEQPAVRTSS